VVAPFAEAENGKSRLAGQQKYSFHNSLKLFQLWTRCSNAVSKRYDFFKAQGQRANACGSGLNEVQSLLAPFPNSARAVDQPEN
jgi:hypothetical protein